MRDAVRLLDPAQAPAERDCERLNSELEGLPPQRVVEWAHAQFAQGLVLSSSFGAESALMLHLVTRVAPRVRVVFLDTGYLFPETYRFAEELRQRFDLDIGVFSPSMTAARQEALYGQLWTGDAHALELYQRINKVEPMDRALRELGACAWLAGLRGEQTTFRSSLRTVELQNGVYKIHPILGFTQRDVQRYMAEHQLPYHPLYSRGYRSIGDVHSTRPVRENQNARAGRSLDAHGECGIHLSRNDLSRNDLSRNDLSRNDLSRDAERALRRGASSSG